jgi:hypothetical protein
MSTGSAQPPLPPSPLPRQEAPDRPPLAPRSALTPSRAQPGWPLPVLLAGGLVAGLLVGAVAGWGTARSAVPPTLAPAQSVDPTVALPQGGTATALALVVDTTAVAPADAAKTEPKTADAADPKNPQAVAEPPPPEVLAPGSAQPAVLRQLPRGDGAFVLVDLQAVGMTALVVHSGSLRRDGTVDAKALLKTPKIHTLRGPVARAELLHFGYDGEAQPVVAHIRTVDRPGGEVEGIIAIRLMRPAGPTATTGTKAVAYLPLTVDPDPPERPVAVAPAAAVSPTAVPPPQ